ncbi:MarR family winged helix-turn-helix transcriptional regulator [Nonomuraea antimicrobica]
MNTAARIWGLNHRLLTAVMNSCSEQLDELGLDTKEFFVLGEVDECRYPAELAARLMMPKASVTVYLRNLVAKGFVQREIDEGDLRRHRLVVTPDGKKHSIAHWRPCPTTSSSGSQDSKRKSATSSNDSWRNFFAISSEPPPWTADPSAKVHTV